MNQRIGYARVSAEDRHLDLQRDALDQAGCTLIYEETTSGKNALHPELAQCLKALRSGDTLVVWRLDRLGRSLPDPIKIIEKLQIAGMHLKSLYEQIETSKAGGKLQFHVFAALAEFERSQLRERIGAGLAVARARGRRGGRSSKLNDKQISTIRSMLRDPATCVAKVARDYGVSRTTIYKHCGVIVPCQEMVAIKHRQE